MRALELANLREFARSVNMPIIARTMRVLILAESCNPEFVSVPLVGWSHYQALSRIVDTHLVTQIRNRAALLRAGLVEGKDFTAIDSEAFARPLDKLGQKIRGGKGKGWTTMMAIRALSQPHFEKLFWKQFKVRLQKREFDLVHQLTPLSPTLAPRPATWCKKIYVPFIWGPINGGVAWPKEFDAARRQEKEWLTYVRGIYKVFPGFSRARKNASAILIGSRDTFAQMPKKYHDKCIYLPENGIDPARFNKRRTRTASVPIRAAFLGRLVPYKGADMLIEAAEPLVREGKLIVDILGDGPEMPRLKAMIAAKNLTGITLHGNIPHTQVQDKLIDADVFAFPSIREFGGGVALEAMAVGVPCIVPNYGGLGELVTADTGWLIPMGPRESIIQGFRDVLSDLVKNPQKIEEKSGKAHDLIMRDFTWDAKAQKTLGIYKKVLATLSPS